MDGVSLARWQQIVDRFELRKGGTNPWDSKKLESNFPGASHHRGMAIKRLLSSTNAKTRFGPRISSSRQGIAIPTRPSSTSSRKMATSFAILERAERNEHYRPMRTRHRRQATARRPNPSNRRLLGSGTEARALRWTPAYGPVR